MYFESWKKAFNQGVNELSIKAYGKLTSVESGLNTIKNIMIQLKKDAGNLAMVGNGGSCAIVSHISQDILNQLKIPVFFLNDASLMTCVSNDFGYESVYSKPLEVVLKENNLLIAISSSGQSKNITNAVMMAKQVGAKVVTLSGFDKTNTLFNSNSEIDIHVPSHNYGIVELGHLGILHAIVDELAGVECK